MQKQASCTIKNAASAQTQGELRADQAKDKNDDAILNSNDSLHVESECALLSASRNEAKDIAL